MPRCTPPSSSRLAGASCMEMNTLLPHAARLRQGSDELCTPSDHPPAFCDADCLPIPRPRPSGSCRTHLNLFGASSAMSDYCIRDIYVFRSEGSVDTKCRSCCALRSGYLLLHHGFLLSTPLLLMLSCRDECCHDSHLPLQAHMQHQQIIHSQILVMLLPSYLVPCRSFGISQHQASC